MSAAIDASARDPQPPVSRAGRPASGRAEVHSENYVRELVIMIFAHKGTIAAVILAVLAITLAIAFLWPKTWSAEGSFLIKATKLGKSPEGLEEIILRTSEVKKEDLNSEIEIVTSYEVLERTITALGREGVAAFEPTLDDPRRFKEEVERAHESLEIEILPDSKVIVVSYASRDREETRAFLQRLFDEYLQYRSEIYEPGFAVTFFEEQARNFGRQLVEKEDARIALERVAGTPDPKQRIEQNLLLRTTMAGQLNLLQTDVIASEREVATLREALAGEGFRLFAFIENPTLTKLAEQLGRLHSQVQDARRLYQPDASKVQALQEQLDNTYRVVHGEVKAVFRERQSALETLYESIEGIEDSIARLDRETLKLGEHQVIMERLTRERDLLIQSYETFLRREEEARISRTSRGSRFSISVVSRPFLVGDPAFPRPERVIPIGIVFALLFGLTIGFLMEYFDHTFKKPVDVSRYADLPTLLSIPVSRRWRR